MIGDSIAHYKVTDKLGAGGMGEVYRARDEKLNRDVALKILPQAYVSDRQRMGRFQREARLLASLNHANIAAIYGLEHERDTHALVLELVEGDDLASLLQARRLPRDEVVDIAVQITEALEFAHDAGVVHRDLKPANVIVTPDHRVKVLDFGLAKAFLDDGGGDNDSAQTINTMSPTLSLDASTAGMVLGTAAYMSPEQARGKPVDRRADIWSFGVLLFEMMSGKQLFTGETISDTLASVIKDTPDWALLPADTPSIIAELIRRCLEKDPRQRLQSIGEARIALQELKAGESEGSLLTGASTFGVSPQSDHASASGGRGAKLWVPVVIAVAVLAALLGRMLAPTPQAEHNDRRFWIHKEGLSVRYPNNCAVSPDGRRVAYFVHGEIFVRDLQGLEDQPIVQSDGASTLFWSHDSEWIAFASNGRVQKVPAPGGSPSVICDFPHGELDGADWDENGMLYLAPNTGPIYVVSERGGDARPLFEPAPTESDFHTPSALPGGRGVLFTTHNAQGRETIEVFANGERKVLLHIQGARLEYAEYVSAPESPTGGFLIFHRLQSNPGVWGAAFDLDRLEIVGDPFLIDADASFPSVSRDGAMLYAVGTGMGSQHLVLTDRAGQILRRVGQGQEGMIWPIVSPDGQSIIVSALENGNRDLWVHSIERGTRTRLTFDATNDARSAWISDGEFIVYDHNDSGVGKLMVTRADGTGTPTELTEGYAPSTSATGTIIGYTLFGPESGNDIYYTSLDGSTPPTPLVATAASELGVALSPDGNWAAYMSNESGRNEVYLTRFPSGQGKWQISTDGGAWPIWSRDGGELLFRAGTGNGAAMFAVAVTTTPALQLGVPNLLFDANGRPEILLLAGFAGYASTDDPDVLVMLELIEFTADHETRLVFTENWYRSYINGRF